MFPDRFSWQSLLVTCGLLPLLGACTMVPARELSFANPPSIGDVLRPQSGLAVCTNEQAATAMALTGFFLPGCETLTSEGLTFRVVAVEFRDLGNNQQFWLVRAIAKSSQNVSPALSAAAVDDATREVWATFPWHDWA